MAGLDALTAGVGQTDQLDARHAIGGLLAVQGPTALDIRTGVLMAPGSTQLVSGTSRTGPKMSALINPHVLVGSRGVANGPYLGPTLEAPLEVDVELAPASGSRIDVVYGRQRDMTSGIPSPDPTPGPQYAVLTGTWTTGVPQKPDLSTIPGATELAVLTIAAGATSTNGSGVTITQTARQTVARGGILPVADAAERTALQNAGGVYDGLVVKERATDRFYDWTGSGWQYIGGGTPPTTPVTINPTGWTNLNLVCFRDGSGKRGLDGWAQNQGAFAPAGGELIGTIPDAALRPASTKLIDVKVSIAHTVLQVEVRTTGALVIARPFATTIGANAVWSFDGASWL